MKRSSSVIFLTVLPSRMYVSEFSIASYFTYIPPTLNESDSSVCDSTLTLPANLDSSFLTVPLSIDYMLSMTLSFLAFSIPGIVVYSFLKVS